MACKGICVRHQTQKPFRTGRYSIGQKRCQLCDIFLKWDGLWCPCCGIRLRTKPRNLKYKAIFRARQKIEEYRVSYRYINISKRLRLYKFIKSTLHANIIKLFIQN